MLDIKMWKIHISCWVLGFLLLATSLTHVQGAETRYVTAGLETFYTTEGINATFCHLSLPDNTSCYYEFNSTIPDTTTTPSPDDICILPDYSVLAEPFGPCIFVVNITNTSLSGVYTLTYTTDTSDDETDIFRVYLHTGSIPNEILQVVESKDMFLRLENLFESGVNGTCEAIRYHSVTDPIVVDSSWGSENHWGRRDQCGFRRENVSQIDQVVWTLRMSSSGGAHTFANISVTVIPLDTFDIGEMPPQTWRIGQTGSLSSPYFPHSRHCELWNPRMEMVQHGHFCNFTQSIVTNADIGNWKFVFGVNGRLLEDAIVQPVTVSEEENFSAGVSNAEWLENGRNLLCTVYRGPVWDCRFRRPDGLVILPTEGIGNADYSYFGDGFQRGDCGLTIHSVRAEDHGAWECTVYDGLAEKSGFLNVETTVSDLPVQAHRDTVVVQQNSLLTLTCHAPAALDYCWFRHPSGLPLRFSTDVVFLDGNWRQYTYEDTLQHGVCTIRLQFPSITEDSGVWTCNLGILGRSNVEYTTSIRAGVSETDVISLEKEVVASGDSAQLKCYSVPLQVPLDYCRFVRPDGRGINFDPQNIGNTVLGKYQYYGNGLQNGECGLSISGIHADEDVGKWRCVARLQGRRSEGHDHITLREEVPDGLSTGAIVGIVLGSVALLLLIGGIIFCIVRRSRSN